MIVTKPEAAAITRGTKHQHRTPTTQPATVARPGPRGTTRTGRSAHRTKQPWQPTPGEVIPYAPPGEPAHGHITITSVQRQHLADVTLTDAKHEGHKTLQAFQVAWVNRHDRAWLNTPAVKAVTGDGDMIRPLKLLRYAHHWQHTEVTVITFEPAEEPARYLADARKGHGDYTTSPAAAIDPAPVADPDYVAEKARAAHEQWCKQRDSFRRDLEHARAEQKRQRGRNDPRKLPKPSATPAVPPEQREAA